MTYISTIGATGSTGATGPSGPVGTAYLSTTTGVTVSSTGVHQLWINPTGGAPAIITQAVLRVTSGAPTSGPSVSLGTALPSYNQISATVNASGLTGAAGQQWSAFLIDVGSVTAPVPAGGGVYLDVAIAANSSQTLAVDLLGYVS